jgi:glycosyltransferase involved in cell wall biosynthesis
MAIPKVSVGVPVYNGERYLTNALTRLLEQEFEDFELIVCDNASTDHTEEICRAFAARDSRIRYFRNPTNIGLAANHNRTFGLSSGQYFKWAAHDDDFPRAMLARFVETFDQSSTEVSLVYSRCEYIDEFGNPEHVDSDGVDRNDPRAYVRLGQLLRYVHMYNSIYGMIRSDMLRRTRLHGLYPMADHVLLAELAMLGIFVELPEPLLRIRRHPGRTFTANKTRQALRALFTPGRSETILPMSLKTRMALELVRGAVLLPIPFRDKIMCLPVAAVGPTWRRFRAYGGLQKQKLLRKLTLGLCRF